MRFFWTYITYKRQGILYFLALLLSISYGRSQETAPLEGDIDLLFEKAREYRNKNNIGLALESLNVAMDIATKDRDNKALVDCYHKFAIIYLKIRKDDTAEFYRDRAKSLLKDISYPYGEAIHKYIDAIISYRNGKNFLAISMLNEAKQINNDRNLLNNILFIEGEIFLTLEKYENAAKNFNSLVVNNDIYEKDYLATISYLKLSELHINTISYEEGIADAEAALKLAAANGFNKEALQANELLSQANAKLGLFESALFYNNGLLNLKDSVFNIEKTLAET